MKSGHAWLPRADCDDRCHSDLSSDSGRTRLRMALRVTAALCLLSGLPLIVLRYLAAHISSGVTAG